jgi:hypothetical protein
MQTHHSRAVRALLLGALLTGVGSALNGCSPAGGAGGPTVEVPANAPADTAAMQSGGSGMPTGK